MIMAAVTSCGSIMGGAVSTTRSTTYLRTHTEIDDVDLSTTQKKMEFHTPAMTAHTERITYNLKTV
jgi:hypothetical protein